MTALVTTPIFHQREFYVPRFELFIGDQPERGALLFDVMQATYKDSIDGIDTFELTINNWDAETRRFKHHDSPKLNPGQRVRLHMGYLDDKAGLRMMVQGVITEMTPTFPAGGQPTLKISGQNVMHSLIKQKQTFAYEGAEASATGVARKICQRLGIQFRNEAAQHAEIAHQYLIQNGEYDILFLKRIADWEGYEIVVEEPKQQGSTVLKFVQGSLVPRVVYELRYGSTLTEFQPSLSTSQQVSSVSVHAWDDEKGEPIRVKVGQESLSGSEGIKSKLISGMKNPVADRAEVITDQPVKNTQTARAMATARLATINQEMVTGHGSVIGLPELRAGSQVYLWGLGRRFSGRYFVTGTTHSISTSGYITQFDCRLEELEQDPRKDQTA